MRQIKFRGKTQDGKWVYGDYHHRAGGVHCIIDMQPDFQGKVEYVIIQVDAETVGQFTGLHDKNGKEIYEGDIIVEPIFFDKPRKVFWDDRFGRFGCIAPTTMGYLALFDYGDEVEVIGNIFDHPELMNPKNE